ALSYMDKQMYGEALDSLTKAIEIYPENQILFYLAGGCSARKAKSLIDETEKMNYFSLAEKYYKRALFLEPKYVDALLGLAVIYAIEYNIPEEAEPLLKTILSVEKNNLQAMSLLARVYFQQGRYEDSLDLYKLFEKQSNVPENKKQARENIKLIEDLMSKRSE
ncbi:MAG: tetratricopeptide repeat protein, partial [Spirochaetota bacterium]